MIDVSLMLAAAICSASADTLPPQKAALVPADTQALQHRAVEHSDAYYARLTIHRIGSYTMLPLFGAEYFLGERLLTSAAPESWLKPTHVGVALGIGALFTSNTITGLWNLWDSRNDPKDRGRRILHSTLLLASEGGFALAASVAPSRNHPSNRILHRNIAIGSMALSTLGTAIMWLRKD